MSDYLGIGILLIIHVIFTIIMFNITANRFRELEEKYNRVYREYKYTRFETEVENEQNSDN